MNNGRVCILSHFASNTFKPSTHFNDPGPMKNKDPHPHEPLCAAPLALFLTTSTNEAICKYIDDIFTSVANLMALASQAVALHQRVRKGAVDEVKAFLSSVVSVKAVVNEVVDGWNAVRVAVAFDRPLILIYLFEVGAEDAPPRQKDGWTSLHIACFHGYEGCVDVLLDAGVKSTAADNDDNGRWPVHCAVQRDHLGCLESLLAHRTDQNSRTAISKSTTLHIAAEYGAVKCFHRLLETHRARIALGITNAANRSVLLEAIFSDAPGAEKCLDLLLDYFLRGDTMPLSPKSPHTSSADQNPPVRTSRWDELCDAFARCIANGRTAQVLSFVRHDKFCDVLLARGEPSAEGHADHSQMASAMQLLFKTWNAPFVGSVLRGLILWKRQQLQAAAFDDFKFHLRAALLNSAPLPASGLRGSVSAMSMVFSTLNKRPRAMIDELFGLNGALHDIIQPTRDLLVSVRCVLEVANAANFVGEFAVPFISSSEGNEGEGCCLLHALLRIAAAAVPYRRSSFWKELSVMVMDYRLFTPPPGGKVSAPGGFRIARWLPDSDLAVDSECGVAFDAHRADLLRSYLEAKHRGLAEFCASQRLTAPLSES